MVQCPDRREPLNPKQNPTDAFIYTGSTCLCRPVYQVPVDGNQSPSTTSPPALTAPTPSSTPGKIQKPSKRQIKAPSENLVKALDAIPHFEDYSTENGASHQSPYLQDPGSGPSHDTFQQSVTAPSTFMPQNQISGTPEISAPKGGGSCCSSRTPKPATQTSTPVSGSGSGSGSCCKKPEPQIKVDSGSDAIANSYFASGNSPYPAVSHTPVSNWEDFQAVDTTSFMPPFSIPHTPAGPPNYLAGYMSHPPAGPSLGFHDPNMSSSNGFGHSTTPQTVPDSAAGFTQTVPSAFDGSPKHNCDCGDECQCLGCATHPFNNTTKEHVREMGLMVALDGTPRNANGLNAYPNVPLPMHQQDSPSDEYLYGDFGQQINMTPYSEQVPASNDPTNGFSSPPTDFSQQMMHTSEYYTLEYPVRFQPACSDVTGSCQCGSDCQCVGCLTHNGHNGVSLEPPPPENHGLGLSQPAMSSACGPDLDTSGLPHLNHHSGTPSSSSML